MLRERERRIDQAIVAEGASSESEATERLTERVGKTQQSLQPAQAARSRMEDVGRLTQEKPKDFAEEVLAPLNDRFQPMVQRCFSMHYHVRSFII